MAWGNGFTINQTLIQQYNLSDPSGFFEDISAVPTLVNRTMLSVHVYGPNITVRQPRPFLEAASRLPLHTMPSVASQCRRGCSTLEEMSIAVPCQGQCAS